MRSVLALWLILSVELVATPVAARERLLAPTDEWRLELNDEDCSLIRTFADAGRKSVRLRIQSFGSENSLRITMIGDGLPLGGGRRGIARFKYRFKPGSEWRESYGTTGYSNGVDALTFGADLAAEGELDRWQRAYARGEPFGMWADYLRTRAAEIRQLALAYPARDDTVLQIGSMSVPFAQIEQCTRDLWRTWGFDPAAIISFRSPPRLINGQQIASVLLTEMQRAKLRQNDQIQYRLNVDEQGRATHCAIQHPRRENPVAALICDVILRTAQIEPAIDAGGSPVRSLLVSRVAFGVG